MIRWLAAGALIASAMTATGAAAQALAPYDIPAPAAGFDDAPLSDFAFDAGRALKVERRAGETRWARDGAVDRLRLTLAGSLEGADGLPALRPDAQAAFEADSFDVRYTRDWPSAFGFRAGGSRFEVTPHAGFSMSEAGGGAEAGATVSLEDRVASRLKRLGVRDGAAFGDRGRWYLFAAASGRSVGLNMLRGADGYERAGWSTDATSALVSDAQAGIGWRRGDFQASLGYLHREIEPRNGFKGMNPDDDELVAFTFSFMPR